MNTYDEMLDTWLEYFIKQKEFDMGYCHYNITEKEIHRILTRIPIHIQKQPRWRCAKIEAVRIIDQGLYYAKDYLYRMRYAKTENGEI